MYPSRSFLLLAGVALLGAIASFNEMMADAQASFLDATGETARGASQSLQRSAVATYQAVTDKLTDATAQERPARVLSSPQAEGRAGGETISAETALMPNRSDYPVALKSGRGRPRSQSSADHRDVLVAGRRCASAAFLGIAPR